MLRAILGLALVAGLFTSSGCVFAVHDHGHGYHHAHYTEVRVVSHGPHYHGHYYRDCR